MKFSGWALNPVNPRIDAYLDRLAKPLERTLKQDELNEYRMGALFHIESLAERERSRGLSEDDAVTAALAEFGSPEAAGAGMLDEWCKGRDALTFARSSSAAVWWSFAHFGLAFAIALLAIEFTQTSPRLYGVETDFLARSLATLAPLVAGTATAYRVPTGNLRALMIGLTPLVPYSLFASVAATTLVTTEQLVGLLVAWPILGALSLSITAWLRRHGRPPAPRKVTS